MLIPSKFRVKRHTYTVHGGKPCGWYRGKVNHTTRNVWVYERDKLGNRMLPEERRETFFHELTHVVLEEMKHPLWNNEAFVEEFARLFTQAIRTSTFTRD